MLEYGVFDNGDGTHHVLAMTDSGGFIVDEFESMALADAVRKARDLNGGKWPFIAEEQLEN